ncbi:MAG TPA: hypothetical protein VFW30_02165 [Bryocella sp.]|nr:hypothetical protein [Bryocella sp.]
MTHAFYRRQPGAPFIRAADEWAIERISTVLAVALAFLSVIPSNARNLLFALAFAFALALAFLSVIPSNARNLLFAFALAFAFLSVIPSAARNLLFAPGVHP